ncbi:MAG: hypothetical protein ABH879_06275 [archaeon]
MNKWLKFVLVVMICCTLFYTVYAPRHNEMPQHVDSWILLGIVDRAMETGYYPYTQPWSEGGWFYPPGSHLLTSVAVQLTDLDIYLVSEMFPAILFVILGLLQYWLAKGLFDSDTAGLSVMAFTTLVFSNITIMGNYYLVPLSFGIILTFLCFNAFIRERWILLLVSFAAVGFTHSSTVIFAFMTMALFFAFNRRFWRKLVYLGLIIGVLAFLLHQTRFLFSMLSISFIRSFFFIAKERPYQSFFLFVTFLFVILYSIGFFVIAIKERRARRFLIPILGFLSIDIFLYWRDLGMLLPYRRLFYYIIVFTPFFVGYGVYVISDLLTTLLRTGERKRLSKLRFYYFISCSKLMLIILLLLLVPMAVYFNQKSHPSLIYVTNAEHRLLSGFGKMHPQEFLATNHLQAYALPVYDLRPVQLSPMHVTNISHYPELSPCFYSRDIGCMTRFFNESDGKYRYLYTQTLVNSTHFVPAFNCSGLVIYEFIANKSV